MNNSRGDLFSVFEKAKVVDLSASYNIDTEGFKARGSVIADGLTTHKYEFYSHAGTHIDAPIHYGVSRVSVNEITLQQLMGRAWVVRIKGLKPRSILQVQHLGDIADKLERGDSLLLHTGWSQFRGQPKYRDQFPRISEELAKWLVKKSVKMLGVEPPSVADIQNREEASLIHKTLMGGNVVLIEGLTNLEEITSELVWLLAMPIKIEKGDGAPARVVAIEAPLVP